MFGNSGKMDPSRNTGSISSHHRHLVPTMRKWVQAETYTVCQAKSLVSPGRHRLNLAAPVLSLPGGGQTVGIDHSRRLKLKPSITYSVMFLSDGSIFFATRPKKHPRVCVDFSQFTRRNPNIIFTMTVTTEAYQFLDTLPSPINAMLWLATIKMLMSMQVKHATRNFFENFKSTDLKIGQFSDAGFLATKLKMCGEPSSDLDLALRLLKLGVTRP